MKRHIAAMAVGLGLAATPALALAASPGTEPVKLTDGELDTVVAGDPLIFVSVAAPISVHLEPITVNVDIPINVAAIVQANVLGNAAFEAVAVGTQNVFNTISSLPQ